MSATAKATYFWRAAFYGLFRSPFIHLVAIATIAISLFAAGLAHGLVRWLDALIVSLDSGAQMTVYLKDDSPELRETVLASIRRGGGEGRAVSPEAALRGLAAELGQQGEVLNNLPKNPLPWTIEASFSAGRDAPALRAFANGLKRTPGVEEIDYGERAVERLASISKALRLGGAGAFLVVLITTIVIVSATLQLAIYGRREEVEIQRLVGATSSFVKAPFLIEGLLQGFGGAVVATISLWAFALLAGPRIAPLFSFLLGPGVSFRLVEPRTVLELVAAGAGLGLSGSIIAVTRFLRA